MPHKVLIGTSGWSYDDWVGPFYAEGTASRDYLSEYAARFPAVEVKVLSVKTPSHPRTPSPRDGLP